jgi:RNA recognition motif-containing protein
MNRRGFGFVTMVHDEDTIPVIKSLNGYLLDGNSLHVDVAKRNTAHTKTPGKCKKLNQALADY